MPDLRSRIESRAAPIGVVGLGYVGLPVACLLAEKGFKVTGVDLKADRVAAISSGSNPIEGREPGLQELIAEVVGAGGLRVTTEVTALVDAEVVIVCVETPVDPADHRPRYDALRAACGTLAAILPRGALVIVESTIAPGTMDRVVRPIFQGSGVVLGHCPERVMPGRLLRNLRTMSRAVGGESDEVAVAMAALYSTYVEADLDLTDPLTAELVKTTENAYRDVNIAFANQVALICEAVGGDVWKVRELVNKSPGRNMLLPGAGVGGHCIPKDPWLLAAGLPKGERAFLIEAGRAVNDSMPATAARLVSELLAEAGVEARGAKIAVLGYAYLEDSDDTRDSPTEQMLAHLTGLGCVPAIHDPFVERFKGDVMACLEGSSCILLMVRHSEYAELSLDGARAVMRSPLFVDARGMFGVSRLEAAGFRFRVLGVGVRERALSGR